MSNDSPDLYGYARTVSIAAWIVVGLVGWAVTLGVVEAIRVILWMFWGIG